MNNVSEAYATLWNGRTEENKQKIKKDDVHIVCIARTISYTFFIVYTQINFRSRTEGWRRRARQREEGKVEEREKCDNRAIEIRCEPMNNV